MSSSRYLRFHVQTPETLHVFATFLLPLRGEKNFQTAS